MLPGLRFLLAAILLAVSILVFGLGAAALLRAAHEEFASNPSWRSPRETRFAQIEETDRPTLAMLRIEPQADAAKMSDAPTGSSLGGVSAPPTAPTAAEPPAAEAEQQPVATTSPPIESTSTEAVEASAVEAPTWGDAAPVPATTDGPALTEEVKAAATEDASPPQDAPSPVDAQATQPEQSNTSPPAEIAAPVTRLASQGDQSATVVATAKADARPDNGVAKPRPHAQRAKAKRKTARARPAPQQAAAVQQPPVFPLFEVPQPQPPPQARPARKRPQATATSKP
jgi:hypothetical protein